MIRAQNIIKEESVPVHRVLLRKLQPRLIPHWSRDHRGLGQKEPVCSEWKKPSHVPFLLPTSFVSLSEDLGHAERDKGSWDEEGRGAAN